MSTKNEERFEVEVKGGRAEESTMKEEDKLGKGEQSIKEEEVK